MAEVNQTSVTIDLLGKVDEPKYAIQVLIVGELAYSGCEMTAVNLGNRVTLCGIDMRAIRRAADDLVKHGRLAARPGHGGHLAYRFVK